MSLMGIVSGLIAPRVMIVQEHRVNGQSTSVLDTGISLNNFLQIWEADLKFVKKNYMIKFLDERI